MLSPPTNKQDYLWTPTVVHSFQFSSTPGAPGTLDGDGPTSLVRTSGGTLFATTLEGGPNGGGTVIGLTAPAVGTTPWDAVVLHSFGGAEGGVPVISFIGGDGALYGTTEPSSNGPVAASVWRLAPPKLGHGTGWSLSVLHRFTENPSGNLSKLVLAHDGSIFGTFGTAHGGPAMFRLTPPVSGTSMSGTSMSGTSISGTTEWSYRVAYRFPIPATARATVSYVAKDGTVYAASGYYASPCTGPSCGRIWKLTPSPGSETGWAPKALYDFPKTFGDTWVGSGYHVTTVRLGFVQDSAVVALYGQPVLSSSADGAFGFAVALIRITEHGWK